MKALFITDAYNQKPPRMERLHNRLKELNQTQEVKFLSRNVVLIDLESQSHLLGDLLYWAAEIQAHHHVIYLPDDVVAFDYGKFQKLDHMVQF